MREVAPTTQFEGCISFEHQICSKCKMSLEAEKTGHSWAWWYCPHCGEKL